MHVLINSFWSVFSGFGVPTLVCVFRVWCSNSGLCVQGLVFHACVDELILVCVLRVWCSVQMLMHSVLCVQGRVFHACVDELTLVSVFRIWCSMHVLMNLFCPVFRVWTRSGPA